MKNYPTIIIAILIALILFVSLRKDRDLDKINLNDSLADINVPVINPELKKEHIVDFAKCTPELSYTVNTSSGKTKLSVIGLDGQNNCNVETIYETDNGYYINECKIPVSLGSIEFTADNFESISKYCKIKSTGTGLLELN